MGLRYKVGFVYTECYIQKNLDSLPNVFIQRLFPTGSKGELHNALKNRDSALFFKKGVRVRSLLLTNFGERRN